MTSWSRNDPMEGDGPLDGGDASDSHPVAVGAANGSAARAAFSDADDAELIERVAKLRDRMAFRMLFERYGGRLKAFMMRAGSSVDDAEEAAQEALVAVWRRAETFDRRRASAQTWLFAIARNKRVDLFRRASRPEPDPNDPAFLPDPPTPPEQVVAAERRDAAVRAAMASLSDEQRRVVTLSFFDARPHSEIASELAIPLGTVKSRLRLAFKKLREALAENSLDLES